MKQASDRRRYGFLMALAMVLGTGTTVGDIGSCGQDPDPLDPQMFFDIKADIDCQRCGECNLRGPACNAACGPRVGGAFPVGCQPLVHDGEVCLRALIHASCDDYVSYMSTNPTAPSECQFCPR